MGFRFDSMRNLDVKVKADDQDFSTESGFVGLYSETNYTLIITTTAYTYVNIDLYIVPKYFKCDSLYYNTGNQTQFIMNTESYGNNVTFLNYQNVCFFNLNPSGRKVNINYDIDDFDDHLYTFYNHTSYYAGDNLTSDGNIQYYTSGPLFFNFIAGRSYLSKKLIISISRYFGNTADYGKSAQAIPDNALEFNYFSFRQSNSSTPTPSPSSNYYPSSSYYYPTYTSSNYTYPTYTSHSNYTYITPSRSSSYYTRSSTSSTYMTYTYTNTYYPTYSNGYRTTTYGYTYTYATKTFYYKSTYTYDWWDHYTYTYTQVYDYTKVSAPSSYDSYDSGYVVEDFLDSLMVAYIIIICIVVIAVIVIIVICCCLCKPKNSTTVNMLANDEAVPPVVMPQYQPPPTNYAPQQVPQQVSPQVIYPTSSPYGGVQPFVASPPPQGYGYSLSSSAVAYPDMKQPLNPTQPSSK
jgi:hypothetical protein